MTKGNKKTTEIKKTAKAAAKKDSKSTKKTVAAKTTKTSKSKETKPIKALTAVFVVGGSQVIASTGEEVTVDNISAQKGDKIDFDKVLLIKNGDDIVLGNPYINKSVVKAEVVATKKGPKVEAMKYKAKSRYRRRWGYRPNLVRFVVKEIVA